MLNWNFYSQRRGTTLTKYIVDNNLFDVEKLEAHMKADGIKPPTRALLLETLSITKKQLRVAATVIAKKPEVNVAAEMVAEVKPKVEVEKEDVSTPVRKTRARKPRKTKPVDN